MGMSDQKEKWQGWLALSTAIMAVLAALTTLYMGKYSSRAIMGQGQESDQWAHYQAKSIKGHTFETNRKTLELLYLAQKGVSPGVAAEYRRTLDKYGEEVKRYEGEKKEIKEKAEEIAKTKLKSQEMGGEFRLCADLPPDRSDALIHRQSDQTALPLVHRPDLQRGVAVLLS